MNEKAQSKTQLSTMILNDSFDYSIKNVLNEPKESNPNPFEK